MAELDLSSENLFQVNVKIPQPNILELVLSDNPIQEVEFLKLFPNLQSLIAQNTEIQVISFPKMSILNLDVSNNPNLEMLYVNSVEELNLTNSEQTALKINEFDTIEHSEYASGKKILLKLFSSYSEINDALTDNLIPESYYYMTKKSIEKVAEPQQKGLYCILYRSKQITFTTLEAGRISPFEIELEGSIQIGEKLKLVSNKEMVTIFWFISELRKAELLEQMVQLLRENQVYNVDNLELIFNEAIERYNENALEVNKLDDHYYTQIILKLNEMIIPMQIKLIRIEESSSTKDFNIEHFYAEHLILAAASDSNCQMEYTISSFVLNSLPLANIQLKQTKTGIFARVLTNFDMPIELTCQYQWLRNLKILETTNVAYLELKDHSLDNHGLFEVKILIDNQVVKESEPLYIEKNSFEGKMNYELGNDLIIRDGVNQALNTENNIFAQDVADLVESQKPMTFGQLKESFGESALQQSKEFAKETGGDTINSTAGETVNSTAGETIDDKTNGDEDQSDKQSESDDESTGSEDDSGSGDSDDSDSEDDSDTESD